MTPILTRIDAFCDAVPRARATATDDGPLRLFLPDGPGHPLYARPVPGATVTAADVTRVRARQRAAGVPEAFEWVHAAAPTMDAAVREAGLAVHVCPLLVLDGPAVAAEGVRLLGADDPDLVDALHAVALVGAAAFGAPAPDAPGPDAVAAARAGLASGRTAMALVTGPDGPLAAGQVQRAGDVAELVGIGTVPAARGRGLGGAVTAALAGATDADLVFLAAGSADATRVYERVGFRQVGECGVAEPA
ncbi:GNAT family N-acetyltransferase [Pseudonocardia broussonetiae]|uniref:GNAT family N-acetyltransferase n=1 Tax=Pseudonocardia broussonetiae TaxID=2736640 RepID=A0A6M6JG79_9PSEU|nr:GNAT family N-acetyltransferase [Pseudonocardia broussonetiae]QJY46984.1 GNAT family N-acetyltransferase [Pseudonocardia broussonetiae]